MAPARSDISICALFLDLEFFFDSFGFSNVPCLIEESKSKGSSLVVLKLDFPIIT